MDKRLAFVISLLEQYALIEMTYWPKIVSETETIVHDLTENYNEELKKCAKYDPNHSSVSNENKEVVSGLWEWKIKHGSCIIRQNFLDEVITHKINEVKAEKDNKQSDVYKDNVRVIAVRKGANHLIESYIIQPVNECLSKK